MKYNITEEEREFLLSIMPRVKERAKTKVRATDYHGDCVYRADGDGANTAPENCCFIGALIPPDKYSIAKEGELGDHDSIIEAIGYKQQPTPHFRRILIKLQNIHDGDDPIRWGASLDRIEQDIKG